MSHVVSIKAELRDLAAVKAACLELGLKFKENQKTIRWFGRWVDDYDRDNAAYKLGIKPDQYGTSDHAIEVPGCGYDIGLLQNPETGGYKLYFDFYGQGRQIQQVIGTNGQKFLQIYSAHKLTMESKKKGWLVNRQHQTNGDIKLEIVSL